jgi:hypothetical protein
MDTFVGDMDSPVSVTEEPEPGPGLEPVLDDEELPPPQAIITAQAKQIVATTMLGVRAKPLLINSTLFQWPVDSMRSGEQLRLRKQKSH